MERVTDGDAERASNEATDWLILLQEEPGDADLRRRFDEWLKASPENESAWASTKTFSDVAALLPAARASSEAPSVASPRGGAAELSRLRTRAGRRWAMPVLALAAAACLAVWAGPTMLLHLRADHVTGTAELRQIDLPDGSRVTLAPASAIAVLDDPRGRSVRLLSGEAFFQVRPDPTRPFRVTARDVEATVLGTSFDVRLGSDDVAVSVEEGIVAVAAAGEPVESGAKLVAGQFVRVASGSVTRGMIRGSDPPELVAAWRHGQLYAQETRLGDAIDQLRRYYGGTIVLTDDKLADRRVTGAYNLADPEDALRGMARVHGATVRRITPWLLIVSGSLARTRSNDFLRKDDEVVVASVKG